MKKARISALLLAVVMIVAVFAGCKGNKGSGPIGDPNKEVSGNLGYELPYYENLGDAPVVKIISHDSKALAQYGADVFKAGYNGTMEITAVNLDDVSVKFINSILAEDPYDISTAGCTPSAIRKKVVQSWDEYIDFSTSLWNDVRETNKLIASGTGGKLYTIMPVNSKSQGVWYNKELFEEYAVKTPHEYLEEDNWNYDTMRTAAKEMTHDTDNDGVTDIWGLAFDNPWDLQKTSGLDYIAHKEDGTPYNNLSSPDWARLMTWYQKLYTEDKVVGGGRAAFTQGKLAMWYAGWWFISQFKEQAVAQTIDYVPQPKDPESDTWYVTGGGYTFALAANSKNPYVAAAAVCSARYASAEIWNDIRNGNPEDPTYPIDEAIPAPLRHRYALIQVDNNLVPYIGVGGYSFNVLHDMWRTTLLEGKPWSTVREAVSPKIDSAIKEAHKD